MKREKKKDDSRREKCYFISAQTRLQQQKYSADASAYFPDLWKDVLKLDLKKIDPDVRTAWEKLVFIGRLYDSLRFRGVCIQYWSRRVTSLNIRLLSLQKVRSAFLSLLFSAMKCVEAITTCTPLASVAFILACHWMRTLLFVCLLKAYSPTNCTGLLANSNLTHAT